MNAGGYGPARPKVSFRVVSWINLASFDIWVQFKNVVEKKHFFFIDDACEAAPYTPPTAKAKASVATPTPKAEATKPKAAAASSASHQWRDPNWRNDLPEAWKFHVRGLSLPMPKGPRALDLIFF